MDDGILEVEGDIDLPDDMPHLQDVSDDEDDGEPGGKSCSEVDKYSQELYQNRHLGKGNSEEVHPSGCPEPNLQCDKCIWLNGPYWLAHSILELCCA